MGLTYLAERRQYSVAIRHFTHMTRRIIEQAMTRAGIILAAGQGTRMKSATPKVMHAVAGLPILGHVIAAMRGAGVERIVVVSHAEGEEVRAFAARLGAESVVQDKQLGTGHAAACGRRGAQGFLRRAGRRLWRHAAGDGRRPSRPRSRRRPRPAWRSSAFRPKDPAAYGRVILDGQGFLDRIVEFKDASADGARRRSVQCRHSGGRREELLPLGGQAREQQQAEANIT